MVFFSPNQDIMTLFDVFFYNVFTHYKPTKKGKANTIALFYISTLQCSLLLLSGIIIAAFLKGMHTSALSSDKAWSLFIMTSVFIYFKNWLQYSGKKRKVLNAKRINKTKPQHYNIILLWCLPIGIIGLSLILLYKVY
ncbi:hypothetical protein SAMN04515667_0374 [Formosa sp. Hel1_31_208]|nr:hypothetical protein SAMN04515667_0374 [Formosa sp. Hel1_31_208]